MYQFIINAETLVLGNAAEIKRLYKTLIKRCHNHKSNLYPLFLDEPMFNVERDYAIYINEDRDFYVIRAEQALQWIDDIQHCFVEPEEEEEEEVPPLDEELLVSLHPELCDILRSCRY